MKKLIIGILFAGALAVSAQSTTNITVSVPTNAAAFTGTNTLSVFMQIQVDNRVKEEQRKKLAVAFEKMTPAQRWQLLGYIKANLE
jgi:hypothetical protein